MIRVGLAAALLAGGALLATVSRAADGGYPFEGSWVRADRTCAAGNARERIYTAHEVTSPRGHCTIRKIVTGSAAFEVFERCERANERPLLISETIRMTGPDAMVLTRQTTRLKLSRSLRFTRCPTVSAPKAAPAKPSH